MYFYLKEPNKGKPTPIIIQFSGIIEKGLFKYPTGEKIHPENWDSVHKLPKKKKGALGAKLKLITSTITPYNTFLQKLVTNCKLNNQAVTRKFLTEEFDKEFRKKKTDRTKTVGFNYLTDFMEDFIKKAPNMINRVTKEKYTKSKITNFKTVKTQVKAFENYRKRRIFLDRFTIEVYDEFITYLRDIKQYSNHTSSTTIKDLKKMLRIADLEFKFQVHTDYLRKDFARPKADSEAIALNEDEIDKIFTHDFSDNLELQNSRDFIIIGLWTGLRFGDFMELPPIDITQKFITVQPNKTKHTTGVSVVIPIHYQVRAIIEKRGMPSPISKAQFNEDFKKVCEAIGLHEKVKGSLMVYIEKLKAYRKRSGIYEKYKLVSSHTCRRSFATNMYYSNYPILSIMKITGHSTQTSFLNYIKVTEQQHGERLLQHWEEYYKERGKKQAA